MIKLGINPPSITAWIILLLLSFPAIFGNVHLGYGLNLVLCLRILDTASLGEIILQELTFREYVQYVLSYKVSETQLDTLKNKVTADAFSADRTS